MALSIAPPVPHQSMVAVPGGKRSVVPQGFDDGHQSGHVLAPTTDPLGVLLVLLGRDDGARREFFALVTDQPPTIALRKSSKSSYRVTSLPSSSSFIARRVSGF